MKQKLIILIGPPCAGKSTWSKDYVQRHPRTLRFNRDDIRFMLQDRPVLDGIGEAIVTDMIKAGLLGGLTSGRDVIMDQTNCRLKYINALIKLEEHADIKFKILQEDLPTLKKRNQIRAIETKYPPIPDPILEKMYSDQKQLLENDEFKKLVEKHGLIDE